MIEIWLYAFIPPLLAGVIVWSLPTKVFGKLLNTRLTKRTGPQKWSPSQIRQRPKINALSRRHVTGLYTEWPVLIAVLWHLTTIWNPVFFYWPTNGGPSLIPVVLGSSFIVNTWLFAMHRSGNHRPLHLFMVIWVLVAITVNFWLKDLMVLSWTDDPSVARRYAVLANVWHVLGFPTLVLTILLTEIPFFRQPPRNNG